MAGDAPPKFRGIFRQDDAARAVYSEAAGIQRILPKAVAVPKDVDDLLRLIEWARSAGITLVPRGSGSSMSGGAIGPGVVVDVSRWKGIAHDGDRIRAGPGVVCAEVNRVVSAAGMRFPVDPSSAPFCTIGGMTATNAAGAHSLAFGSMRDWVTAMRCVFADGSTEWVSRDHAPGPANKRIARQLANVGAGPGQPPRVRKNSSGYATSSYAASRSLVDLLVGSEGTLALFAEIELRLTTVPAAVATVMGVFPSLDAATEAAIRATEAGVVTCELLDRTFLDFISAASGRPVASTTEAILLSEIESDSPGAAEMAASLVAERFRRAGATETRLATSAAEQEVLWALRHAASPTLARLSARYRSMQFIEDGAVPPERLGDYVRGVRAALDRQETRGVIFGHAGDAHVHVNPLVDVTLPDWRKRVDGLLDEVTALVASLGGTLSGEHGDGRVRTPLLDRVWPEAARREFGAIKTAFDPGSVFNAGVKVGSVPGIGTIKYDPALPPLPPDAARALAEVESARGYDRFRLELLS